MRQSARAVDNSMIQHSWGCVVVRGCTAGVCAAVPSINRERCRRALETYEIISQVSRDQTNGALIFFFFYVQTQKFWSLSLARHGLGCWLLLMRAGRTHWRTCGLAWEPCIEPFGSAKGCILMEAHCHPLT